MIRSWSVLIARLFGIELRIHLTFFLLLFYVLMTEAKPDGASAARGVALVVLIFASVLVHEIAHLVLTAFYRVRVRSVTLFPFGGVTLMDDFVSGRPLGRRPEILIALAGPVLNLTIAGTIAGVVYPNSMRELLSHPQLHSDDLLRSAFWTNLYLGLFNLLPAYPMDGGRILRAWFSRRMDLLTATRRAVTIGQAFAILFIVLGLFETWLMLVGLFLFFGAQLEERTILFRSVLESVHMRDVMLTDFATLSPADTLEDALSKAVHSLQDDFPVVRGIDMVGVVSRQTILDTLRREGNAYVQSVMGGIPDSASPTDTLATALRNLTGRGLTVIPVVDQDRLVGIVTLQNLMRSMALLAESRRLRRQTS